MDYLKFFSKGKEGKELSNFWIGEPVELQLECNGEPMYYPTGEHAFHGAKFDLCATVSGDPDRMDELQCHAKKFRSTEEVPTPLDAKRAGGKGKAGMALNPDELHLWSQMAGMVQRQICDSKIARNESVGLVLDNSGDRPLLHQDNRPKHGNPWGGRVVKNDRGEDEVIGENGLGKIWEEVRAERKRKRED